MRSSFECLISDLDVRPLMRSLETHSDLWNENTARQTTPGSPHGDTQTIFLKWSSQWSIEAVFNDIEAIDLPAFYALPEARTLIANIVEFVRPTRVGRAIIVSLKPGGVIQPHVDEGHYADTYERFHCVLQSGSDCTFHVGRPQVYETAEMKAGEVWWFNHKRRHWVTNRSDQPRIHLILDLVAARYRMERDQ